MRVVPAGDQVATRHLENACGTPMEEDGAMMRCEALGRPPNTESLGLAVVDESRASVHAARFGELHPVIEPHHRAPERFPGSNVFGREPRCLEFDDKPAGEAYVRPVRDCSSMANVFYRAIQGRAKCEFPGSVPFALRFTPTVAVFSGSVSPVVRHDGATASEYWGRAAGTQA